MSLSTCWVSSPFLHYENPVCFSLTAEASGFSFGDIMTASRAIPQWMRDEVFKRDKYTCQYCGTKDGPFHCDHVYPWSKGGETSVDNLVTACRRCNGRKSNRVGLWPRKVLFVQPKPMIFTLLFMMALAASILIYMQLYYFLKIDFMSFIIIPSFLLLGVFVCFIKGW